MSVDVCPHFKVVANTIVVINCFKVEEYMRAYLEIPMPSHMFPVSYIMKKEKCIAHNDTCEPT
jgi:hypothetical protein